MLRGKKKINWYSYFCKCGAVWALWLIFLDGKIYVLGGEEGLDRHYDSIECHYYNFIERGAVWAL